MNNENISEVMNDSRVIFIDGPVDEKMGTYVIGRLLYLDSLNSDDITIYINSPGGSVSEGLAITDTMELLKSKVNTIGYGLVASMGAVILACGNKRMCLRHTRCMIHQVYGGMQGTVSDVEINYNNLMEIKNDVMKLLSEKTGKNIRQIEKDCNRDYWMSASEAVEYGLIDEVLKK